MDDREILGRVGRILNDHNATMRKLGELDKMLAVVPQTLADLVGDPNQHPVREYFERVTALSRDFHIARRDALLKVKKHGKTAKYRAYAKEAIRGSWSLGYLHFAGFLYRLHLIAIVDVKKHEAIVQTTTLKFPSFCV